METVVVDQGAQGEGNLCASDEAWGTPFEKDLPGTIFWFDGRISRLRWWMMILGSWAILAALGGAAEAKFLPEAVLGIAIWPLLWVLLCAEIRRWHDLDRSGVWCLVNLIPILGPLYAFIVLGFDRGTKGYNQYGADPLDKS